MNLKKALTIVAISLISGGYSQTKLLAFKSHNGSMNHFEKALLNPKMDLVNHNLGMAPQPIIRNSKMDSLIFISDSQVVMVTSQYCTPNDWYYRGEDTSEIPKSTIWSAGKDTVLNHPLFSNNHSLDSIKEVMKNTYYFRNDVETAVFIGYDNGPSVPMMDEDKDGILDNEGEEEEWVPALPGNGGIGIILMSILLASILIGLMSWMMSRRAVKSAVTA